MKYRNHIYALVLFATVCFLAYLPSQKDFQFIFIFSSLGFLAYFFIIRNLKDFTISYILFLGIVLRLCLLFSFPNLSDDIYRFLWDGQLLRNGTNPYAYTPVQWKDISPQFGKNLFEQLNSRNYYSIYPPFAQLTFYISSLCKAGQIAHSTVVLKLILFTFELGCLRLLYLLLKVDHLEKNVGIYALNPLVIVEIMGNAHYEGLMLFFLLGAIYSLKKLNFWYSGISFGMGILTKILPILFAPILLKKIISYSHDNKNRYSKILFFLFPAGITVFAGFYAFVHDGSIIPNYLESLDLYNKKFEFNASIYYILRFIGYKLKGFNLIHILGPVLSILTVASIIYYSFKSKNKNIFENLLFIFCIFLLLSRTVHPWYSILPLAFCSFGSFRFPLIWTYLIGLTYINYSYEVYNENLWVVGLEYAIAGMYALWEIKKSAVNSIIETTALE